MVAVGAFLIKRNSKLKRALVDAELAELHTKNPIMDMNSMY